MWTRRKFLQAAATASLLPRNAFGKTRENSTKSNVVLIMVDDLSCALGCYGATGVQSPHIDRFAARGVRFERNYCQYPVCNPSRQSILTGLRPDTTGIVTNYREAVFRKTKPDAISLPQLLRRDGYFTASLGKVSHRGMDAAGNFADNEDPLSWDFCGFAREEPNQMPGEGRSFASKLNGQGWPSHLSAWRAAEGTDEDQEDGRLAAAAVRLLEQRRDTPFFLAVGFHKPHEPYVAPKNYFDLYPPDSIQLPSQPADRTPNPPIGLPQADLFVNFDETARRELKRAYLACVSFTDAQIGKVLAVLDRMKLWDETIVVLMADHGYHLWQHDWMGKCTSYELAAQVPLIVWAPGRAGMGRSAAGLTESLDLYPTLADLCGVGAPAHLEGASFVPLLDDPSRPGKEAAYTEVIGEDANFAHPSGRRKPNEGRRGYSVRSERWRFTEWSDGKTELYDHRSDPLEYHSRADDPACREVCAQMRALLHRRGKSPAGPI